MASLSSLQLLRSKPSVGRLGLVWMVIWIGLVISAWGQGNPPRYRNEALNVSIDLLKACPAQADAQHPTTHFACLTADSSFGYQLSVIRNQPLPLTSVLQQALHELHIEAYELPHEETIHGLHALVTEFKGDDETPFGGFALVADAEEYGLMAFIVYTKVKQFDQQEGALHDIVRSFRLIKPLANASSQEPIDNDLKDEEAAAIEDDQSIEEEDELVGNGNKQAPQAANTPSTPDPDEDEEDDQPVDDDKGKPDN
jgi:hypothetical protein